MNLKQLAAFREVMLTGSVSEAARNLNRTQPAISAQISALESHVGLILFTRAEGRLRPVPEAQYLLVEATEILKKLSDAERTLNSVRNLDKGMIQLICMPGPSVFLLPELISQFVQDRPGIKVSMLSRSSYQVNQLLSAQCYDIGLADMDSEKPPTSSLVNHDVLAYACMCAIPFDDPLADKKSITAKDLSGKPMATLSENHPTCRQLKTIFDNKKLFLNRRFETQYFIPLLTFVEQHLAYAIVDPLSAESYRLYRKEAGTLVFRPFSPTISFALSIVTPSHRTLSNVSNAFQSFVKERLLALQ